VICHPTPVPGWFRAGDRDHNKRVIIVSTRGGKLAGQPYESAIDHQEAYLRAILNFIGVTDITFVRAEGLGLSPESRVASIDAALREMPASQSS